VRTVKIACAAASTSWVVDRDAILVAARLASSTSLSVLISDDPGATLTETQAPASSYNQETLALPLYFRTTAGAFEGLPNLKIPIFQGKTLYFTFSTVGSVILLLDDPPTAE